jgi:DNA replication protein DnaC
MGREVFNMVGNPRERFADIPIRFAGVEISDFDGDVAKTAAEWLFVETCWSCRKMFDNELWTDACWRTMIINGPVGVGKTHMAVAMLKAYLKRASGLYTTAYSMSRRIMADKNADYFNSRNLLVIDEINRTFETKAERDRFFDLVNYRYENLLPLLLVGNIQTNELKELLGDAVSDRIRENVTVMTMEGDSRR